MEKVEVEMSYCVANSTVLSMPQLTDYDARTRFDPRQGSGERKYNNCKH
jgi:hypothetical protein